MTDPVVMQQSASDATEQKQTSLSFEEIEKIFRERYSDLRHQARKWSRNDADDIVQEVFLKLLKQTKISGCLEGWLNRATRTTAVDRYRRLERQRKHELAYVLWKHGNKMRNPRKYKGEFLCDEVPWSESTVTLKAKEKEEMLTMVRSKHDELPVGEGEIITLHFYEELTFAQIAEQKRMSKSSAHRKCDAALSKLRKT